MNAANGPDTIEGQRMEYNIEYAGFCIRGPRRQINEDNLLCGRRCLPAEHSDMDLTEDTTGSAYPLWLAVCDGVGGEARGEEASYLAARWLAEHGTRAENPCDAVASMNRDILRYAREEHAPGMGTTISALRFGETSVNGFNVGDSRCYRLSGRRMERLSEDHARYAGTPQHRLLTQYIGIEESDFLITPHIFSRNYQNGDIYMLCTDGVTDLISDRSIKDILSKGSTLQQKLAALREIIESRGVPDNATVILARVNVSE